MVTRIGLLTGLALAGGSAFAAAAPAARPADVEVEFDATFGAAAATGAGCDGLFTVSDYHVRFALTGPTERIAVMQLAGPRGFFDKLAFEGLYGGDNDVDFDQTLVQSGVTYAVNAQGTVGPAALFLDVAVTATAADGKPVCTASATLTGFTH